MRRALGNGRLWKRVQDNGAVWVADWKAADGSRQRRVLSSDKGVAQRKLALLIRERDLVASGLGIEEGIDRPVVEVADEFLAELTAIRSKSYVRRVRDILARVQASLRCKTLRDLRPQALLQYRRSRLADGVANRTANMEIRVVGTLLNWCVRIGVLAHNPLGKIQMLPTGRAYEKRPRRAMSEAEVERFLAAAQEIDSEALERAMAERSIPSRGPTYSEKPRLQPIPQLPLWLSLLETGARFGELTSTCWADLSESNATLTLRALTTKAKKERVIPLRRELVETLRALRLAHHARFGRIPGASDPIFVSPTGVRWNISRSHVLKRYFTLLERAGIPRIDARGERLDIHALRHTCASRLARNGVGLVLAQKLLGHSDPKLTACIYSHVDVEDLRGAVEGLPALRVARG